MPETKNRKFKILGAGWIGMGGLFFAVAFVALLSVVIGDDPATAAFEAGDKWWVVALVFLALGAIFSVNGLALLRRDPVARPVPAISLVLLIPSALLVVTGSGVLLLLVVAPSLWLTLSRGDKKAYTSNMAKANG